MFKLIAAVAFASTTQAFAPSPLNSLRNNVGASNLDAAKGDINIEIVSKAVLTSALSFSLLFGPTPALADGK